MNNFIKYAYENGLFLCFVNRKIDEKTGTFKEITIKIEQDIINALEYMQGAIVL